MATMRTYAYSTVLFQKGTTEQVTDEGKIASYIVFANRESVNATPF